MSAVDPVAAPRGIRPTFRGTGLYATCKRCRLPIETTHALLRAMRGVCDAGELKRRRALFAEAVGEAPYQVAAGAGYVRLPHGEPRSAADALACCQALYAARAAQARDALMTNERKPFLLRLLSDTAYAGHPEILRLALDRAVIDTAARYLGDLPLLASVQLWWTPPNQTVRSSQIPHVDFEDTRQLKLFLNVTEVADDQGPLTFYTAEQSRQMRRGLARHRTRFRDALLDPGGAQPVRLTGPAGAAAFVDTSSCLHYGSRGNVRDRVVLMFQYLRFDAPCAAWDALWKRSPTALSADGLDAVQRAVIGLR